MIPHHQVAIDISLMLQKKTKNPTNNKEDLVIKGILDYGGSDGQVKLQYDYGGKGGSFSITKNTSLSNINDSYYDVVITDIGMGFKDFGKLMQFQYGKSLDTYRPGSNSMQS